MFYTYLWLRGDGTPYYAGKGSGRRAMHSHFRHRPPKERERIIVQEFETEQDTFIAERLLISFYGRKDLGTGCLQNRTDGGEGTAGVLISENHKMPLWTEARKAKERSRMLGNKYGRASRSEEFKRRISEVQRGKVMSPEAILKRQRSRYGDDYVSRGKEGIWALKQRRRS